MLPGLFSETTCTLNTSLLNVPEVHEQQPSSFHQFVFSAGGKKQLIRAT